MKSNTSKYVILSFSLMLIVTARILFFNSNFWNWKHWRFFNVYFSFFFENVNSSGPDVTNLFTVIPNSGTLTSLDRPTQVQVIFRAQEEVNIKEQPILKCQVIEPNIAESGEIIASIPVKVSVKAVFNKWVLKSGVLNFMPSLFGSTIFCSFSYLAVFSDSLVRFSQSTIHTLMKCHRNVYRGV